MRGQINRGDPLGEKIFEIASRDDVKNIVDIGTWNGFGTTKCIYDAAVKSKKNVWTLECNKNMYEQARRNYLPLHNFNFVYGTITEYDDIKHKLVEEKDAIEHHKWLMDEFLMLKNTPYVYNQLPENIDLLVLDGGEYSSSVEFFKLYKRTKYIALDDTRDDLDWNGHHHILKNSEVRKFILNNPDKFKVLLDNQRHRNGCMVVKVIK